MRDIKFRAWNESEKRMTTPFAWVNESNLISNCMCRAPSHALMQFTGIKDCNGVDIYEGDIVNRTYKLWPEGKTLQESLVAEISCSTFDDESGGGQDYYEDTLKLEIIGNIYENPELQERKP